LLRLAGGGYNAGVKHDRPTGSGFRVRRQPPPEYGRAVVIGASMAGLLAARVLADHYREVVVFERDDEPVANAQRRGVPQGAHSHVLLASGSAVLETLFPGFATDLVAAGATSGDIARDVRWYVEGGTMRRFTSDVRGFGMSRPLLESAVRARIASCANIRIEYATNVRHLRTTNDRSRVIGLDLEGRSVDADLVIDASGRGSRTPRWLDALGYGRPVEERVEIDLRYTTRLFRRQPRDLQGDQAAIVPPTPAGKRGGGMVAVEGDRWIVTLITHFDEFAPTSLDGFVAFARTLPAPWIHDVIIDAEPLGEAHTTRVAASVRHRYERMSRFPERYLVVGDAVSSFNPIYGQGMSVAAQQIGDLASLLRERRHSARRFFTRASRRIDAAWTIAAGNDLRMQEAVGARTLATTFINAFVPRLIRAGHRDPASARAFFNVSNLLAPPHSLVRPRLIWRALRNARGRTAKTAR